MEEACLSGVTRLRHEKIMAAGELKGARHVRGAGGEFAQQLCHGSFLVDFYRLPPGNAVQARPVTGEWRPHCDI